MKQVTLNDPDYNGILIALQELASTLELVRDMLRHKGEADRAAMAQVSVVRINELYSRMNKGAIDV